MAATDYQLPTIVSQDDSLGSQAWVFPQNITANDSLGVGDNSARAFATVETTILRKAYLVLDNVIQTGADNKGTDQTVFSGAVTLGGASDDWGLSLTGADVKKEGFGFAISFGEDDGVETDVMYYLVATGFNFDLPDDAVIDGVEVYVDQYSYASGGGTTTGAIDYVAIRLNYTWDTQVNGQGRSNGYVYIEPINVVEPNKKVRYIITDSDNNVIGDWRDVINEPSFKREINNLLSTMTVQLGRNELTQKRSVETLVTEDGIDDILTEDDETIFVYIVTGLGLGEGTDLDLNYNLELQVFYGSYVPLTTEDDQPLYTESGELIVVAEGYPMGRTMFTGFLSDWELDLDNNISVPVLSHSHELNQIMLETEDIAAHEFTDSSGGSIGIAGSGPSDNVTLAQTVTIAGGTKTMSGIAFWIRNGFVNSEGSASLDIYTGSNPNSLGTLVAAGVEATFIDHTDFVEIFFPFTDAIEFTNTSTYTLLLNTDAFKTGGNPTYPVNFRTGTGYTGGTCYAADKNGTFVDQSVDINFRFYEVGGDTKVPFNSYEPSQIAREVIDFLRRRGARVNYTDESIEDTGTEVSYTYNLNTGKEALDKIPELCPADWYSYYDPGTNLFHLHPRPDSPERYFTKKKDIIAMKLRRSLQRLVNQVYLTGGGDPALLIKVTDTASREAWRKGLKKISDNRVTDSDTANIMAQSAIDRGKDPEYSGTITIGIDHYDYIEDINLGEMSGYQNFGNFIDNLSLQLVSITYNLDTIDAELQTLLPPISKRIEDIKRNLDVVEQQNNPDSPS